MNKKFKIGNLFYNEKFLVIFSVVLSFIIWIFVSVSGSGPDTTTTITNIPINIQLSQQALQDNLRVFEVDDQNLANVTVSGNSLVLGSLNSGSISVTSNQASTISSPGQYELSLVAKPADGSSNFSISQESLYPQKVKVTVDKYNEATYPIVDNVKYKIGDGYFGSTTTFAPETINISGPETVMNKVAGVRVDYTIDDTLTSSKTITAPITVYDIDGNALSDSDLSRLTISSSEVSATIQVLKKSTVPLVASFSNVPAGFDINSRVTVTPSSIDIAGPEDVISKMKNITLPTIDLSTVDLDNNTFELKVPLPDTCKNLNNAYTATVQINTDGLDATPVNVTNFEIINSSSSAEVKTSSILVEAVGLSSQLDALQGKDVIAQVDLSSKSGVTGITEVPIKFKIDGHDSCWIYGNYTVNVEIK